ncbi:MAG: type II toxin-antitoxin system ParD family antitoxin [Methylobacter sp.]|nr:type II toxin-antitoxin system ParD family antitoxin [Methylobacter sp.]
MHISLTPELESIVKEKVASGFYNNASEVVREALRFMKTNEELVYQIKLNSLRSKLVEGEHDLESGNYTSFTKGEVGIVFQNIKNKALDRIKPEIP